MNAQWLAAFYPAPRYRLLSPGECILPGDEFYSYENTWRKTRVREALYLETYRPYRRRIR